MSVKKIEIFPCWLYSKHKGPKLFENQEQVDAQEGEWFDTPVELEEEPKSEEVQSEPSQGSEEQTEQIVENYHDYQEEWPSKEEGSEDVQVSVKKTKRKKAK